MRLGWIAALPVLFVASAALAAGSEADDMAAAANGFYGVYRTFHPSDGIPSAADRAKYSPFLSPALETLLSEAAAAETRFSKANKDSPPLIEGDLFTSMFEGATSVQVGTCSGDSKKGRCSVKLEYDDKMAKPTTWNDTVFLVNTSTGWRVDDIAYGGSWAFGNKGRLTELLRQTAGLP
ncbi:MAG TPA: hypothetical protein VGJ08_02250 [Rhizomicrobium sp.]|jgi:hypothetical protein